jgi:hypothetical protein
MNHLYQKKCGWSLHYTQILHAMCNAKKAVSDFLCQRICALRASGKYLQELSCLKELKNMYKKWCSPVCHQRAENLNHSKTSLTLAKRWNNTSICQQTMDKQNVYTYNGILLSERRYEILTCNMLSHGWTLKGSEELYDCSYEISRRVKFTETGSRLEVAWDWEEKRMGSHWVQFLFGVVKSLKRGWWNCITLCG